MKEPTAPGILVDVVPNFVDGGELVVDDAKCLSFRIETPAEKVSVDLIAFSPGEFYHHFSSIALVRKVSSLFQFPEASYLSQALTSQWLTSRKPMA